MRDRAAVKPAAQLRRFVQKVPAHLTRSHTLTLRVDLSRQLQTPVGTALRIPATSSVPQEPAWQFSLRIDVWGLTVEQREEWVRQCAQYARDRLDQTR